MSLQDFLQFVFAGITSGSVYALTALGFTLIYNATGIINFAQGEFVMLGGLAAVSLHSGGAPLALAAIGAVAVVTVVGLLFELLAIRPLLNASVLAQIIVTVGASLALRTAAMLIWGREAVALPAFTEGAPLSVFGATVVPQTVWVLGVTALIVIALQVFYRRTLLGKAVRACAVNPMAARLLGIPYGRVVLLTFGASAAVAAAGGVLITPISFMSYSSGALIGLKGFAAAILGGLGSPAGAVAGGLALGLLESLSVGLLPWSGASGYKDAIAFLILLLVLFARPQGLLGQVSAQKV